MTSFQWPWASCLRLARGLALGACWPRSLLCGFPYCSDVSTNKKSSKSSEVTLPQFSVPWLLLSGTLCFPINSSKRDATWTLLQKWFSPGDLSADVGQLNLRSNRAEKTVCFACQHLSGSQLTQLRLAQLQFWPQGWKPTPKLRSRNVSMSSLRIPGSESSTEDR